MTLHFVMFEGRRSANWHKKPEINSQDELLFLVLTQSQETQKTINMAAMLVSQTKEIIKILLKVRQHGRHDVR